MIRRSIDDGELAFYHCYNPHREPIGELVRVAGRRWPVEECFATGKGHVGLDNYQVRLYHAWYRHITLAMLAHTFLAILAHRHRAKKGDPPHATPPNALTPPATDPPPPAPPAPTRRRRADAAFARPSPRSDACSTSATRQDNSSTPPWTGRSTVENTRPK